MSRRVLETSILAVLALLAAVAPSWAQDGAVRVTVARANVRTSASERAQVLTQVTSGTILTLKAIEGDWYRVELPPDARLGGARLEAFISKKVATLVAAPTPTPPPADGPLTIGPPRPPAPVLPVTTRDGMSVSVQLATGTTDLTPEAARFQTIDTKAETIATIAPLVPEKESLDTPARDAQVAFVWTVAGASAAREIDSHRPTFFVLFKEVPGIRPEDLTPVLLKLTPTSTDQRVVALVRARADQPAQTDPSWNVSKDLRQDVVKAKIEVIEPGAARIQPSADLQPGEYAVAVRLGGNKRVAGSSVLSTGGAGRLFGAVWTFSIK
jgi:hypothetical protein